MVSKRKPAHKSLEGRNIVITWDMEYKEGGEERNLHKSDRDMKKQWGLWKEKILLLSREN